MVSNLKLSGVMNGQDVCLQCRLHHIFSDYMSNTINMLHPLLCTLVSTLKLHTPPTATKLYTLHNNNIQTPCSGNILINVYICGLPLNCLHPLLPEKVCLTHLPSLRQCRMYNKILYQTRRGVVTTYRIYTFTCPQELRCQTFTLLPTRDRFALIHSKTVKHFSTACVESYINISEQWCIQCADLGLQLSTRTQ